MSTQLGARISRPIVAITGASSGIGGVFARKLAPDHDFILIARRRDRLDRLSHELSTEYGSHSEILQADLSQERDLAVVAEKLDASDRLAVLVNNAGFGTKELFWEASLESQMKMHQLHVIATMRLSYVALRNMVIRDSGAVINVSSVAAFVRGAGSASYCASKSWMAVFTEALHLDLQSIGSNVYVQALCPGYTYSEFHDTVGVDRKNLAPSALWMTGEQVVDSSLRGLHQRKLLVVPGWHYRFLSSLLPKIPVGWRIALESAAARTRGQLETPSKRSPK
jgi:uncharacterized protein